jgi:uncharacterized protein
MSEENVEIVRRMYEAFHSGDAEGALAHFDPDVVVDASSARPDGGRGQGHEQLNAIVNAWVGTWDEWREEIGEMRDLGSRVLVLSVQYGRGKGSGVEVEAPYALLYDVQGGKITRLTMFRTSRKPSKPPGCRSSRELRVGREAVLAGTKAVAASMARYCTGDVAGERRDRPEGHRRLR